MYNITLYPYWKYIPKTIFLISIFYLIIGSAINFLKGVDHNPNKFYYCFFSRKIGLRRYNFSTILITIILSSIFAFYRIHYAIAYFWILALTFLFIPNLKIKDLIKIKFKKYLSIIISISLLLVLIFFGIYKEFTLNLIIEIFLKASNYFTIYSHANTTRWDVGYLSIKDIFSNLSWGLPSSIIGLHLRSLRKS